MVSLRDPVRDNLLFVDFAQGVVGGCVLLAALSMLDYERLFGKLSFVPLLASFVLSVLLVLFGYGPGTSDAKVNLFGFQPVEIIRLLLVLLPGRILRHALGRAAARARNPAVAGRLTRASTSRRVEYIAAGAGLRGALAGLLLPAKGHGPALVFACLFLVLYGIARGSAVVPAGRPGAADGAALRSATSSACRTRSASASPCGFRPGTTWCTAAINWRTRCGPSPPAASSGTGIGLGDPQLVPAAHTDLILSALGEEWGFLGVLAVFALYACWSTARCASRCAPAPITSSSWPRDWPRPRRCRSC